MRENTPNNTIRAYVAGSAAIALCFTVSLIESSRHRVPLTYKANAVFTCGKSGRIGVLIPMSDGSGLVGLFTGPSEGDIKVEPGQKPKEFKITRGDPHQELTPVMDLFEIEKLSLGAKQEQADVQRYCAGGLEAFAHPQ